MPEPTIIDDWLDRWEDLRGQGMTLDQFVDRHCRGAPPALVTQFKARAQKVAFMDSRLRAAAGSTAGPADTAGARATPSADFRRGSEPVPGYRLEHPLGRGGSGQVWRATGPGGVGVALKLIPLGTSLGDKELRALELLKGIRHVHVLGVSGSWQVGGWLVVAMELADRSLHSRLAEVRSQEQPGIPRDELLQYMADAAEALDFLNEPRFDPAGGSRKGIQHRDIKPPNLLLVGGRLKVGDFGLARALEGDSAGRTRGVTYEYASPEALDEKPSDRSDQYSLAVTYCELRGGRLPFTGSTARLIDGHLRKEPDLSMLPAAERAAVARALEKTPEGRWPSCRAFVAALRGADAAPVRHAEPVPARRVDPVPARQAGGEARPNVSPQRPRRRWPLAVGGGAVALLLGAALLAWLPRRDPPLVPTGHEGAGPGEPAVAAGLPDNSSSVRPGPLPETRGLAPAGDAPGTPARVDLVVYPFEKREGDRDDDGFRLGLADLVADRLSGVGAVRVRDPAGASPAQAAPAAVALRGGFAVKGEAITVDVRLLGGPSGGVLSEATVSGTAGQFADFQSRLLGAVASGLGVALSDADRRRLAEPMTADFRALREYGLAREALGRGAYRDALDQLDRALGRDPRFGRARRAAAGLQGWAIHRGPSGEATARAGTGAVGRSLEGHHDRHREVLLEGEGGAPYLAAFLVVSAHAGLMGQRGDERRLLGLYWQEFAARVPPGEAMTTAAAIRKATDAEGKFFQDAVDGGRYGKLSPDRERPEAFLKPGLHPPLRWPRYAAFWPFDPALREAYGASGGAPGSLERAQPRFPHDYLRNWLADPEEAKSSEALRLRLAVLRYYAGWPSLPADLAVEMSRFAKSLLGCLDPARDNDALAREAVEALEAAAKMPLDAGVLKEAEQVRERLARQIRLRGG